MAQSAVISVSTSGDNQIVAAVAGFAIRVIGYVISFSGTAALNVQWFSDAGGSKVALSGLLYGPLAAAAPTSIVAPESQPGGRGWFQTASGKQLNLNLSGAVAVGGHVMYELVSQ